MWDLGSPVKVGTHITCTGRPNLNHWTARDIPSIHSFLFFPSIHSYFYCHHHCCSLLVLHPLRANKKKNPPALPGTLLIIAPVYVMGFRSPANILVSTQIRTQHCLPHAVALIGPIKEALGCFLFNPLKCCLFSPFQELVRSLF